MNKNNQIDINEEELLKDEELIDDEEEFTDPEIETLDAEASDLELEIPDQLRRDGEVRYYQEDVTDHDEP